MSTPFVQTLIDVVADVIPELGKADETELVAIATACAELYQAIATEVKARGYDAAAAVRAADAAADAALAAKFWKKP